MPDQKGHMSEVDLVRKVVIILIIVNFTTTLFSYFVGQGLAQGQGKSALTTLSGLENKTNSTTTGISKAFSNPILTPYPNTLVNAIPNIAVYFVNFIGGFLILMGELLYLMGLSVYIVAFMLFGLIPSLFSTATLGFIAPIFEVIYGFSIILIAVYGIYLISKIILPFIPFISGSKA